MIFSPTPNPNVEDNNKCECECECECEWYTGKNVEAATVEFAGGTEEK
jgi:hypothetical protein